MEAVLAILALLGGALAFLFKRKADQAKVEAIVAETKTKDKELELTQEELEEAIAEIDASLAKIESERAAKQKKDDIDSLSLKDRAERIRKGLL